MRWRKILSLFALLFLLLASQMAQAERDIVRIGFFNSEKYGYTDKDGDLRGFDVHLSKTIGMYGGFIAEMVGYDSIIEMEEALRTGQVDVLIDFLHTNRREQEFIFTETPIMEEQIALYTLNSLEALTYETFQDAETLRIGYVPIPDSSTISKSTVTRREFLLRW